MRDFPAWWEWNIWSMTSEAWRLFILLFSLCIFSSSFLCQGQCACYLTKPLPQLGYRKTSGRWVKCSFQPLIDGLCSIFQTQSWKSGIPFIVYVFFPLASLFSVLCPLPYSNAFTSFSKEFNTIWARVRERAHWGGSWRTLSKSLVDLYQSEFLFPSWVANNWHLFFLPIPIVLF